MNWNEQDRIREASFEQQQRRIASTLSYTDLLYWRLNLINPTSKELAGVGAVIRGHHLRFYKRLLSGESSYLVTETSLSNKEGGLLDDDVYAPDLLGVSPLDQYVTQTLMQATYERYKRLSPNSKVTVTTTYDQICNSCAIGRHCRVMDPYGRQEDGEDTWRVYKVIEKQGNATACRLRATIAQIPEYKKTARSAILELSTTKSVMDRGLSEVKNLSDWSRPEDWQTAIDEMITNPNVIVDSRLLTWVYKSQNFIKKRNKA